MKNIGTTQKTARTQNKIAGIIGQVSTLPLNEKQMTMDEKTQLKLQIGSLTPE